MKTTINRTLYAVFLLGLILSACSQESQTSDLANPASIYCLEQGYRHEMREDENGTFGVCIFPDASECEEWAYLRAGCGPGESSQQPLNMANPAALYCEEMGGRVDMRENQDGQYGVCVFPDQTECEEWALYRGECETVGTSDISEPFSMPVIAVYGSVIASGSDLPAPSKLVLAQESLGSVYIMGANADIETQILSIRDKPMPANKANFWGSLDCPSKDNCLMTVTQMRVDGPGADLPADLVEGWTGVVYSGPPGPRSGGDDYFTLLGQMPFQFGIDGADDRIRQQIKNLRDSGQPVRIWGQVFAGRMDWNGTQIIVSKIETIEADPSLIPPAPAW